MSRFIYCRSPVLRPIWCSVPDLFTEAARTRLLQGSPSPKSRLLQLFKQSLERSLMKFKSKGGTKAEVFIRRPHSKWKSRGVLFFLIIDAEFLKRVILKPLSFNWDGRSLRKISEIWITGGRNYDMQERYSLISVQLSRKYNCL